MKKPGSILKIAVRNFVTYSEVELKPGPHLNMIIGANGSGKSTIVAAIILGLGGNPKTVGRGSKISEYVKHGCETATIEITLQSNSNEEILIARSFDTHDKTSWKLNNKNVTLKEIEKIIKQYSIQVDNLCQFLPQDRVQDFAKLNKQQLLQQTQVAICRNDLLEKQLELVKLRERHKEMELATGQRAQKLIELKEANLRIEGRVTNIIKQQKYVKFIEDVDRKLAWLKYESNRMKLDEIKQDKKKITETLNVQKSALAPLETAIGKTQKVISASQRNITTVHNSIRTHQAAVHKKLERVNHLKSNITRLVGDLNSRIREIEGRNQEIAATKEEITMLTHNKTEMLKTNESDEEIASKIKSFSNEIQKTTLTVTRTLEKKNDLENSKRDKAHNLHCLKSEMERLENVKQQRLEWLRRVDKDAVTAVQWLRNNKDLFKGEIFEPMLLELNVLNSKHAIYIENTIPVRDRVAFTCVEKEDMNKLITMLRDEQNLSVNVVYSGADQPSLNAYRPVIPIEQLKPYGMFSYIRSLIAGPEPIMKYLCKTYHIHNTPVGNHLTNERFDKMPVEISNFFSDTFRFSTSYSRYTGEKSTRQAQIKSDNSFGISINTERIEMLRGQIGELEKTIFRFNENIRGLSQYATELNNSLSGVKEKMYALKKRTQEVENINSKLRILKNNLEQLENNCVTKEQVEEEHQIQIKQYLASMISEQTSIKDAFKKYYKIRLDSELDKIQLEICNKQIALLQNKIRDIQATYQRTEETLNVIKTSYANKMAESKSCLEKAKQLSKGFTPDDEGFDEFRESYNNLPHDVAELDAEKEHTVSKMACLSTADVGEVEEYQRRCQLIADYEGDIQNEDRRLKNIDEKMSSVQKQWLEPLEEIVHEINKRFGSAFERMGCAGEITICKGESEKDFADYGLSIKVKYRDAEPLQELNNIVQSGGERAVATAAFMLSLQELTTVPFRCVDEINQGMDASNERRIFALLVDATSGEDTSQYFFITPKLIPNLRFVKGMTVHVVHNGCFVPFHKEWNNVISNAKKAILQE